MRPEVTPKLRRPVRAASCCGRVSVDPEAAGFRRMVAAEGSWRGRSLPGRSGANEAVKRRRRRRRSRRRTRFPPSPAAAVEAPAVAGAPAAAGASPAAGTPAWVEVSLAVGAAAAAGVGAAWSAMSAVSGGALTHLPASPAPCSRCVRALLASSRSGCVSGRRWARSGMWQRDAEPEVSYVSAAILRGPVFEVHVPKFPWTPHSHVSNLKFSIYRSSDSYWFWLLPLLWSPQSPWKVWVRNYPSVPLRAALYFSLPPRYKMRKLRLKEVKEVYPQSQFVNNAYIRMQYLIIKAMFFMLHRPSKILTFFFKKFAYIIKQMHEYIL